MFDSILAFFSSATTNDNLDGHRYDFKKHLYIQSLMHAVNYGVSFFNREHFQTISMLDFGNKNPNKDDFRKKYDDVLKIPSLVKVVELIQDVTDEVFSRIESHVGAEPGSLYKPEDKYRGLTLHRTAAINDGPAHMAAEAHFDFLTANVLFYNYNDGFKIFENDAWKNISKPPYPMVFFNLGN